MRSSRLLVHYTRPAVYSNSVASQPQAFLQHICVRLALNRVSSGLRIAQHACQEASMMGPRAAVAPHATTDAPPMSMFYFRHSLDSEGL